MIEVLADMARQHGLLTGVSLVGLLGLLQIVFWGRRVERAGSAAAGGLANLRLLAGGIALLTLLGFLSLTPSEGLSTVQSLGTRIWEATGHSGPAIDEILRWLR